MTNMMSSQSSAPPPLLPPPELAADVATSSEADALVLLLVVLLNDIVAPVQVVAGAGIAWIARFAGKTCVRPDWVKSKPLLLVNVMVSAEAAFGATVAGAKASVTTGAIGVMVIGA